MIDLHETFTDDSDYIEKVRALVLGAVVWCKPQEVYITKIDHWFGERWLAFSGKALGAIGVRLKKLTLPPFVPSRVVNSVYMKRNEDKGAYRASEPPRMHLHRWQPSTKNFQRRVDEIAPEGAFFWYTGATAREGRGALMAYLPVGGEHWPWYIEYARQSEWERIRVIGVSAQELVSFEDSSACEAHV